MNKISHSCPMTKQGNSGITLIELIVVMALIGLIAGLTLPFFSRSLDSLTIKTTVKEIAATLRRARSLAISEKGIFVFSLDISGREYFITKDENKLAKKQSDVSLTKKYIYKKLKLEIQIKGFLRHDDATLQTDGVAKVLFYPQGNSSGGAFIFETKEGNSEYTVITNRLSGRTRIKTYDS